MNIWSDYYFNQLHYKLYNNSIINLRVAFASQLLGLLHPELLHLPPRLRLGALRAHRRRARRGHGLRARALAARQRHLGNGEEDYGEFMVENL